MTDCVEEPVYRFIYSFHMPLFMMVSGYFAVGSMRMDFFSMTLKKVRQILLPCFTWITIVWICLSLLDVIKGNQIQFVKLYWGYLNQFWFLKSLFICYLLAYFACKNKLAYVIAIILSQCISYSFVNMMFPSFMIGMYLRNLDVYKSVIYKLRYILLALFCVMLCFFDQRFWNIDLISSKVVFYGNIYYVMLYCYKMLVGLLGAISIMMIFLVNFKNIDFPKFITRCGSMTLGIYILQSYILERFIGRTIKFDMDSALFIPIVSVLVSIGIIIISVFIINLLYRSRFLNLILLGMK